MCLLFRKNLISLSSGFVCVYQFFLKGIKEKITNYMFDSNIAARSFKTRSKFEGWAGTYSLIIRVTSEHIW